MNKPRKNSISDLNETIMNTFFTNTTDLVHSKIGSFRNDLKRLQFNYNIQVCSKYYRSNKLKRLNELLDTNGGKKDKKCDVASTDVEDYSEGYYTGESLATTTCNSIMESPRCLDFTDVVVPSVTISEIKHLNSVESEATLIWSLLNTKTKKLMHDNSDYLDTIQEYEIFSFCVESLQEEEKQFKLIDRKNIDQSEHWDKIGCVNNLSPPVRCVLRNLTRQSIYYFAIRIKYKSKAYSEFSDIKRTQF